MYRDSDIYVVVSDLHLSPRNDAGGGRRTVYGLSRLLAYLADENRPPTVVFNGDFLDLVMARTDTVDDAQAAVERLGAVLDRHAELPGVMADYVRAGGRFVILAGNHDMEWCRDELRDTLRERLVATGGKMPEDAVSFHDGALCLPGRVYIDHGHQFDPDNRVDYVRLHGDAPEQPPKIMPPLGALIARHLLATMPTDAFFEDEGKTPLPLLLKALSQGVLAGPRLIVHFYRAAFTIVGASFRRWFSLWSGSPGVDATPATDRAGDFGRSFWAESVMDSPLAVMRRMYLDRSLLFVGVIGLLIWMMTALSAPLGTRLLYCAAVLLAVTLGVLRMPDRYGTKVKRRLELAADEVARRLNVQVVLFGHVHDEFRHGETYVNPGRFLRRHEGAWTIHYARLHLTPAGCRARVCRWELGDDIERASA